MGKYFGTDGVRGIANDELTPHLAYKIGRAGAFVLEEHSNHKNTRTRVIIGTDTRISKDLLSASIAAGVMSVGADVIDVGVIPTPGIAYLTRKLGADAGIVISASHNPMEYNGIKFFGSEGLKLPDEIELEIEDYMDNMNLITQSNIGEEVGKSQCGIDYVKSYEDSLVECLREDLKGLNVTLDCAHGAAYKIGPEVFKRLGAHVHVINHTPNGININDEAGSTCTKGLSQAVLQNKSDIGLAFDGDADRLIAIDEEGNQIDGDKIMLICAKYLTEEGKLSQNKLVVTVMSNLGLHMAAKELGIEPEVTAVGDRYVLERMLEKGYSLGGEQSGHMIFLDYNTTGDGILSALMLSKILKKSGKKISQLAEIMEVMPQVLINAKVKNATKENYQTDEEIQKRIKELEKKMEGKGRVLIRHSGTEPLVRVMLEGEDQEQINTYARELADFIEEKLNATK